MSAHYMKHSKILALTISLFFSSCSLFETEPVLPKPLSEREVLFQQAEELFQDKNFEKAKIIYSKLSRNSDGAYDSIYDKSLWRLSKLYEKDAESSKDPLA